MITPFGGSSSPSKPIGQSVCRLLGSHPLASRVGATIGDEARFFLLDHLRQDHELPCRPRRAEQTMTRARVPPKKSAGTVAEIRRLHEEIGASLRLTLDKAIRVGELLSKQKAGLAHGEWLPWVKANCPFAGRTAREYMRFYQRREELKSASLADLSSARKLLTTPPEDENEFSILWRQMEWRIPGSSMSVIWDGPEIKKRAEDDPHAAVEEYARLLNVVVAVSIEMEDLLVLTELRKIVRAFAQGIAKAQLVAEARTGELSKQREPA